MLFVDARERDVAIAQLAGTDERPYDSLRESFARKIRQMREKSLVRPELWDR